MPHPPPFLDLPPEHTAYEGSRVVVLPVPLERTTSYGKGTAEGPAAILRASTQVELYEEQTRSDPFRLGIATLPPFPCGDGEMRDLLAGLEAEAARHLRAGKLLVSLGGEHSLTLGPLRAALAVHGTLGVVQFDAHADLRPEYEGSPFSHACIMSRVVELALPTVAVGIRALSREEGELIAQRSLPTIWGWELEHAEGRFAELVAALPEKVYLTFDLDFLDPSIMPATGTPVPGGGGWQPTLRLLRHLFTHRRVVALDVVELAPHPGLHACDFLAASLVYKMLALWQQGSRPPAD